MAIGLLIWGRNRFRFWCGQAFRATGWKSWMVHMCRGGGAYLGVLVCEPEAQTEPGEDVKAHVGPDASNIVSKQRRNKEKWKTLIYLGRKPSFHPLFGVQNCDLQFTMTSLGQQCFSNVPGTGLLARVSPRKKISNGSSDQTGRGRCCSSVTRFFDVF